jgi:hypothetical protein
MKPRLIITLVQGHLITVADGDIDAWIETSHDTRKIEPQVVTREEFDALLAGKTQVDL